MIEFTSDKINYGYRASETQAQHNEKWQKIDSWPYEVSDLGRVRRTEAGANGQGGNKCLKPHAAGKYPFVLLSDGLRRWPRQVHLLVAAAFLGPTPSGMEVNHKDRNKWNPALSNLEFVTPTQNIQDSVARGHRGSNRWNAVLTENIVKEIREMKRYGCSAKVIAASLGLKKGTVDHIVYGNSWRHVPPPDSPPL